MPRPDGTRRWKRVLLLGLFVVAGSTLGPVASVAVGVTADAPADAGAATVAEDAPSPATDDRRATADRTVFTPATVGPPSATNVTPALESLRVDEVWPAFQTTGEGVTVAVLDAGIAVDEHPALAPPADGWVDFVGNETEPVDRTGHGTLTAGVVAGNETTDGIGYGVAPGVDLVYGRVIDERGDARTSNALAAIDWAIDHPREPDVLVLNIGEPTTYESYIDAIAAAREDGIYVVAPAGNGGPGTLTAPGNVYNALSVGATDGTGEVAAYSGGRVVSTRPTWGARTIYDHDWPESYVGPRVVAPGTTTTADADGGYREASGTSVAAPHVAGTVALMQAASDRHLRPAAIDRALVATARYPGASPPDTRYGYGVVDAYAAVGAVADKPPYFEVTQIEHDGPVDRDEEVEFTATVENVGNETATQLVVMSVDGERFGSRLLTLAGGETAELRRSEGVTCIEAEPRESSITITTDNTSRTVPIEVCAV